MAKEKVLSTAEKKKFNPSNAQIIALGYLITILFGSFLLSLPISSSTKIWTSYIDSLFTATSATCVTGLVVYDTFSYWSIFGQIVILLLIQIGGIGFMTIITLISIMLKKQIMLHQRKLLMESTGTINISGVVNLIKRILIGTLIFETLGTILLATRFCRDMGFWEGIFNAIFHSVSAFCNAGFDLMGKYGQFSSLTHYVNDIVVNITIMLLIVIGGIGFIVWNDILMIAKTGIKDKDTPKKLNIHSKVVLFMTALLIFVGAILFFIFERKNTLAGMNTGQAIMASFFQSITPRTAGFNTIDTASLTNSSSLLTMIYMFIGGSPGSTAGGIKTTTFLILIMGIISTARQKNQMSVFKHNFEEKMIKQATAIASIYLFAILISTIIISAVEDFSFKQILFETISALGTVGLTTGITPLLSITSKIVIMLLMYGGRVGALSLILAFSTKKDNVPISRPAAKILLG